MKMLPVQLSLNPPLGLWSDVLWRHPLPSPLVELKTQLPPQLAPDPRLWGRDDVSVFLRFCEREFDLPKFEYDLFQMNGKALCLLNRTDFGERCPGAGDVLHNVLQMLMRESQIIHRHLPSSPVTPTSRYPLSPHSHPPTPTWPSLMPDSPFHNVHNMHHFMPPNSVTLSPAPSIDSQASSPPQDQNGNNNATNVFSQNNVTSSSSNQSDSDDENFNNESKMTSKANGAVASATAHQHYSSSPPTTPILKDLKSGVTQQISNSMANSWAQNHQQQKMSNSSNSGGISSNGSVSAPTTPNAYMPVKREFFPENGEPNTNGRLLWDFLQQLLNDRNQKYSDLIAWKCRDTGVFKIVDPAGLAKLWGIQKNHLSMNYDKMSRALRYYYRVNILRKVQGERHCYQFLRNPTELKNIKNISLLRQSVTSSTNNISSSNGCNSSESNSNSTSGSGNSHHQIKTTPQSQLSPQQIQQRPSSRGSQFSGQPGNLPALNVPTSISTSSAAAAVAAAAAAAVAYGPPPTSPLFMHAINGAFHYLSNNGIQPPNSPVLPPTPSEKLQFSNLKIESNPFDNDDMKPTDLSVSGSERRSITSYGQNNSECYPLIRNADGLTTIKLIRFNESGSAIVPPQQSSQPSPNYVQNLHSPNYVQNRHSPSVDIQTSNSFIRMDNDSSNDINVDDSLMPTDLRK